MRLHKMLPSNLIFYSYSRYVTRQLENALNQLFKICIAKILNKWGICIKNIQATIQNREFFRIHERELINGEY